MNLECFTQQLSLLGTTVPDKGR